MGYHVVRFAPSNKLTFFDYDEHPKYVARFLDTLKNDLKLTKNPIITHIFSSACSFILYQHMIKDMARKAECVDWKFFIDNHRAAIFDCGPGRPVAPYQLWHGVAGLNKSLSLPVRYLVSTLFVAYAAVFHYGQLGEHYYTRAFDTVVEDDRLVPALVLYSEKDSVVSSKSVEEMAARRKHLHKGLFLKTVAFKDTDHVLIYNKYKEEYVKYINEHLNMCKLDINTVLKK
jgi:pimeloyl-ACP methyl ester carboxylesterase